MENSTPPATFPVFSTHAWAAAQWAAQTQSVRPRQREPRGAQAWTACHAGDGNWNLSWGKEVFKKTLYFQSCLIMLKIEGNCSLQHRIRTTGRSHRRAELSLTESPSDLNYYSQWNGSSLGSELSSPDLRMGRLDALCFGGFSMGSNVSSSSKW